MHITFAYNSFGQKYSHGSTNHKIDTFEEQFYHVSESQRAKNIWFKAFKITTEF